MIMRQNDYRILTTVSKSRRIRTIVRDGRTAQNGVVGVEYGSRHAPARVLFLLRNSRRAPYLRQPMPRLRVEKTSPLAFRRPVSTGNGRQLFPVLSTSPAQCRRHRLPSNNVTPSRRSTGLTSGLSIVNCRSQREADGGARRGAHVADRPANLCHVNIARPAGPRDRLRARRVFCR